MDSQCSIIDSLMTDFNRFDTIYTWRTAGRTIYAQVICQFPTNFPSSDYEALTELNK